MLPDLDQRSAVGQRFHPRGPSPRSHERPGLPIFDRSRSAFFAAECRGLIRGTIAVAPPAGHSIAYERPWSPSLEGVTSEQADLIGVEASLQPTQGDVVDPLHVAQLQERLTPPADQSE